PEIGIGGVVGREINEDCSGGDDLPVRQESRGIGVTSASGKARSYNTARTKGGIRRSICIISNQCEVAEKGKLRKSPACDQNFTIGLDDHGRWDCGEIRKICRYFTVYPEGEVSCAIQIVADYRKIFLAVVVVGVAGSGDDQFAVRLKRNCVSDVRRTVEIRCHFTAAAEGLIKSSASPVS